MNRFEEAIQIAKGVTNFLRMKAHIANNDIEELQKKRYAVCLACEFRSKDDDSCTVCGCPLKLRTRAPGAGCPKEYWKEVHRER
jgi:uncharacterized paraquat-inducible protein A